MNDLQPSFRRPVRSRVHRPDDRKANRTVRPEGQGTRSVGVELESGPVKEISIIDEEMKRGVRHHAWLPFFIGNL